MEWQIVYESFKKPAYSYDAVCPEAEQVNALLPGNFNIDECILGIQP